MIDHRLRLGAAGAVCVLPYAIVYLLNLWGISHYQFFPLSLGAVGYLAYSRWSAEDTGRLGKTLSWLAFGGGVVIAAAATLFASTWMAYLALVVFVVAVLARVRDMASGGNLAYLALPMLLIWQPPYSPNVTGDGVLIARLQNVSAGFSSRTLDLLGVLHECPGTVIRCAGKSFGVEEACSGVQSFFSLLCFASLVIVYFRRGALHSLLLIATSVFWAVVMNTVRITLIPIAYLSLGVDLSHGLAHTIVGLSTMGMGILLLLSTDRLLRIVPGVDRVDSALRSSFRLLDSQSRTAKPGKGASLALLAAAPLLLGMGGLQLYDIVSSWGQQKSKIDFFAGSVLVDLFEDDGLQSITNWSKTGYIHEDRVRGADFGERSDIWYYQAPIGSVLLSLDQAFPGWHELPVCYTNIGWKLDDRQVLEADGWPIVLARFSNTAGENGVLVFSMFDESGEPVAAPTSWSSWNAMRARVQNRLSPNVRGALFSLAAYQVQCFVQSPSEITNESVGELLAGFKTAREHVRTATLDAM